MSECEESTTDLGSIRDWYAGAVDEAEAAFDRAVAAHDRELREQIEQEVRADMFHGVRAWVERFSPGDRWDPQDDLDHRSSK